MEKGQALILIAIAMVALFAMLGLAVDGSAAFSDRRHAQNAADTAALAGALAKVNGDSTWTTVSRDRANSNGYNGDLVTSTVEVYSPPISGIYSNCSDVHFDCNNYVQVIITTTVNTFFGNFIGIAQIHNRVEAVASTTAYNPHFNFGGNAVVALSPTGNSGCPGALTLGGASTTTITGGGIYSNSDSSSCAFNQNGCRGTITVNGGSGAITTVGGMNLQTSCAANVSATLSAGAVKQFVFPPPIVLSQPTECSTAGTATSSGSTTTLTPGYYSAIPASGSWKSNIVLSPGVYCIGTQIKLTGTSTLKLSATPFGTGSGVFIYIKAGGSSSPISLQGGDVQLWPQTSGSYQNYLLYVAPDYTGSSTSCTINGSSGQQLLGTIYAPYCDIKINGTSGSGFQSQLIGYTVDLSGSSDVTINYNPDNNGYGIVPRQVGLSK